MNISNKCTAALVVVTAMHRNRIRNQATNQTILGYMQLAFVPIACTGHAACVQGPVWACGVGTAGGYNACHMY
jgi:hypothetical protein